MGEVLSEYGTTAIKKGLKKLGLSDEKVAKLVGDTVDTSSDKSDSALKNFMQDNRGTVDLNALRKSGKNSPSDYDISSKQFGKKWGKHKTDYPEMQDMSEYKKLIDDVFRKLDKIIQDIENNEFLYIKGNDLLGLTNEGNFVSLYPGANSGRVLSALEKGGLIWPK